MESNVFSSEQIPKHRDFYDDDNGDSSNYNLSVWCVPCTVLCVLRGFSQLILTTTLCEDPVIILFFIAEKSGTQRG